MKQKLVGKRFGKLLVINEEPERANNSRYFKVLCDCGNTPVMHMSSIKRKIAGIKSCGCANKHNGTGTRLHSIWQNMKQRCLNPKNTNYRNYGKKGITICTLWLEDFTLFRTWALNSGYHANLTIDRKNGKLGYTPLNCRWVDQITQTRNSYKRRKTNSKYIGVCFYQRTKLWAAYINVDKKRIHLGFHSSEYKAAIARDSYIVAHNLQNFIMNEVL
jgi:hypothetical protein